MDIQKVHEIIKLVFNVDMPVKQDPQFNTFVYAKHKSRFSFSGISEDMLEAWTHNWERDVHFLIVHNPPQDTFSESLEQIHSTIIADVDDHNTCLVEFRFCKASADSNYAAYVVGDIYLNPTVAEINDRIYTAKLLNKEE